MNKLNIETKRLSVRRVLESPVAVFFIVNLVAITGLIGLIQITDTLLLPSLFFALTLPAMISSVVHLKAPVIRFERYCMDKLTHSFSWI